MAKYNKTSPYYSTSTFGKFLDILNYRSISRKPDDLLFTIDRVYQYRPDILAFDLYGDSALWWVFKARNPNAIDDPIFDFQAGMKIYIPNKGTLEAELGV